MKQKICLGDCYAPAKHKLKKIKIRYISLLVVLTSMCLYARAQQQETFVVTGKVTSAASGAALANVTVTNLRNQVATRTNSSGEFTMNVLANDKLTFSLVAYDRIERSITGQKQLSIKLQPNDGTLDEVVVIGYGKTSRRLNTGSVSSITAKDIEGQPVTNVLSALSGRMPGVFVQTANGLPGGNINIQIRGKGSIAAGTQPLYIIDGVPSSGNAISASSALALGGITGAISPLNTLNPTDIQSISVLKDADATAIYGSRGANGVIIITTKRSESGKTRFTLDISQGASKVASHPNLLSLDEYLAVRKEAFENDGLVPSADPTSPTYAPDIVTWDSENGTDWSRFLFGHTAGVTTLSAGINGGRESTSFGINANYRREGTVLRGSGKYTRKGLRMTLNHELARFKIHASGMYNADDSNMPNPAASTYISLLLAPNYPLYNADGIYNWYAGGNPLAQLNATNKVGTRNLIGNMAIGYKASEHFELNVTMGYSELSSKQTQLFPTSSIRPGRVNSANFGKTMYQSFIVEPLVRYDRTIGDNKFNMLLGGTYQATSNEYQAIEAANFSSEHLMENLASAGVINSAATGIAAYRYVSTFLRATYNHANQIILNGTLRRDGSSRFGEGSRYGTFYSVGVAWLFSEWLAENLPAISFGKIRASYGTTGNDQIPDYQYMSTYTSGYIYQDSPTLRPSRIANDAIKWETTRKRELGLELGFLKDRILLNGAYFDNKSSDQLVNYTLPRHTGFASYQANLPAVIRNQGWEFELMTTNIETPKFLWRTAFNVTFPKNRLLSFTDFDKSSYRNIYELGYDINRIYGYQLASIDSELGTPQYLDEKGGSGTPFFFHTLGSRSPKWYGGVSSSFRLGRVQLDVFGQFSRQSMNGGMIYPPGVFIYNNYGIVRNRWKHEGDVTTVPKASTMNNFYYSNSSANVFDVRYFRLKNVAVSYTLNPKKAMMNVYVRGQNLMTFWDKNLPLLDPETGAATASAAGIPPLRSIIVGVNITF